MKARLDGEGLCKNCRARPVYVENDRKHDFCGIRCAKAFQSGQPRSPAISDTSSQRILQRASRPTCRLDGCTRPVFLNTRQREASEFCCNRHRLEAVASSQVEGCVRCREWPKITIQDKVSDFCGAVCRDAVQEQAPSILPLFSEDKDYGKVASQFLDGWRHPTAVPKIHKIWKIYSRRDLRDQFEQYKLKLERKTDIDGGNTKRRWHGTVRACNLGDDDAQDELCADTQCSLCHIIQSSFQVAKFGQRTNFGRFGEGIYTSATSSKANDYVASLSSMTTRAMLLNYVVMGKAIKMTANQPNLKEPPTGYDSVVGEPGGDLNYDESIVYDNDAIRPIFLVIYKDA